MRNLPWGTKPRFMSYLNRFTKLHVVQLTWLCHVMAKSVFRFWSLPWTNEPNTRLKWKLKYSPIPCAHLDPSATSSFFFAVHRLCGVIEGRLSHFLPRWLRTAWQSVISQGKIPWNTPSWLGIKPGPRGGQKLSYSTELSWLTCSYTSLYREYVQQKYRSRVPECSFSPVSASVSAIIAKW